jgi:phytoene dehydrogenase-like protein
MGALSAAIARAAVDAGAEIRVSAPVKRILLAGGPARAVCGVELCDGSVLECDNVLSAAAPHTTFIDLLADHPETADALPVKFVQHIRALDVRSGSVKINVALNALPSFLCLPNVAPGQAGPQHRGTVHFETSMAQLEAAFLDSQVRVYGGQESIPPQVRVCGCPHELWPATPPNPPPPPPVQAGRASTRPVIEMTLPSVLDSTLAPPGHHVALLFCQYAPYHLTGRGAAGGVAGCDWASEREAFARRVFSVIDEHAPGFSASIVGYEVLAPPDLEAIFGLPGGNICHAAMSYDQLLWMRPVPGWARYATPIPGLWQGGAGCHPGGGVMGAPGYNAAHVMMKQLGWRASP